MNKRGFLNGVLLLALHAAAATALAQTFPARPVRLVVPQPAGTSNDVLARTLADQLGKTLGQPVVVENKPGANGTIAANYTISQPADGHTLFLAGVSNLAWNPHLYSNLSHVPSRDFAGVALIANTPFATLVSPALGVKTFADLVKKARQEPGKISFASAGIGNSTHLAMELISERAGMKLQHVPFNGPGLQTSLLAEETPVMTGPLGGVSELVRTGKLSALAVTGYKRLTAFPNVPTFKELSYDVAVPGWYSIVVRSGTAPAIIQRLNAEINKAMETPEMKEKLANQVLDALGGPPSEVERLMKRDA
ncbi:MAG: Bug family tripartite tricarboxylate transporter substrate binding protein, partial [Polaromonas sp.]